MSRYKKLFWICIVMLLALGVTWLAMILFSIWEKLNVEMKSGMITFQQALVGSERKFLADIRDELADCPNYELVMQRITDRLRNLQSIPDFNSGENKGILAFTSAREQWQGEHLQGQIECLGSIIIAVRDCENHQEIVEKISDNIVSARRLLTSTIAMGISDNTQRLAKSPSQFLYCPPEANHPMVVQWKGGGQALIYGIALKSAMDGFPAKLQEYYSSLGWKALRYDISEPLQLGGIEGGWREGEFWSQAWKDEQGNVIVANIDTMDDQEAEVIIMHVQETAAQAALEYYKRIHGDDDADPSDEVIRTVIEEGYRFMPIRQRY